MSCFILKESGDVLLSRVSVLTVVCELVSINSSNRAIQTLVLSLTSAWLAHLSLQECIGALMGKFPESSRVSESRALHLRCPNVHCEKA